MTQTNISVVVNNYFASANNGQKVYSVVVSHESEVHNNYLFTDRQKAIAKMEEIVQDWRDKDAKKGKGKISINRYFDMDDYHIRAFGKQYGTKLGYWYGDGEYEYGNVELVECVLE